MAKRFKPVAPLLPGFEPEAGDRPAEGPSVPPSGQTPQASPPATTAADERAGAIAAMLAQSDRPPGPPPQSLAGQTVWAVDCHSLIHQVFHALPEMTSPRGEPVAAVYGFARDLLYLLESKRPDFLFCAFDLPGKTFRHAMYPQYKEHRPAMPEDLAPQIDFLPSGRPGAGDSGPGDAVVRGRRHPGHPCPARRATRRPVLRGHQ